jgi:hypothetical protein
MKKALFLPLFIIIMSSFLCLRVEAAVNYIEGFIIADCNTCQTDYDFRARGNYLGRSYGVGNFIVYNDVIGIFRTLTVTTMIFEEGPETWVFYVANIVPNTSKLNQSFSNYMYEKQSGNFLEEFEVTVDRNYYVGGVTEELWRFTNKALQVQLGAWYIARVKIGSTIKIKTKNDLTIVVIKDKNSSTDMYQTMYIVDKDGEIVDIPLATSIGGGLYRIVILSGSYVICVTAECGFEDGPPVIVKEADQ